MANKDIKHLENTVPEIIRSSAELMDHLRESGGERHLADDTVRLAGNLVENQLVIARSAHEHQIDGKLIGAHEIYDPDTPLDSVQGIMPANHGDTHTRLVYINGIWNDEAIQRDTMQRIANATGAEVIGLHNATGLTGAEDVLQSAGDKLDFGDNPAVEGMARLIEESVRSGEPLNVVAHSQGALCTSRAVDHAIHELTASGMDPDAIKDALSNVHIQTFGGAAVTYPDGPQYYHHINTNDLVPNLFGYQPLPEDLHVEWHHWLRDTSATLEDFHLARDAALSVQHSINDTYIPHINLDMLQPHDTEETVVGVVMSPGADWHSGSQEAYGRDAAPPMHHPLDAPDPASHQFAAVHGTAHIDADQSDSEHSSEFETDPDTFDDD